MQSEDEADLWNYLPENECRKAQEAEIAAWIWKIHKKLTIQNPQIA